MSLRLKFREARAKKGKAKRGTYYIEGTDHRGERVHQSLHTGDRDIAKAEFAKRVAETTRIRIEGPRGVANFANAVKLFLDRKPQSSNARYLDEMLEHIGTHRLCDLTQTDLDKLAKAMRPGAPAATLTRHVYTPFISAWNAAVEAEPPLAEPKRWRRPEVPDHKAQWPSDDEINTMIELARAGPNPQRDVAALMFLTLTGARTGEAWPMRPADVNLERGMASVQQTKTRAGKIVMRKVALTPELVEALRPIANNEPYIFGFTTRWGMPQMITRLLERAGLPDYRPHEIGRHAFCSRMLESGHTTFETAKAVGHKDTRMVEKFYGHLAQDHLDTIVSAQKITPKREVKALEPPAVLPRRAG